MLCVCGGGGRAGVCGWLGGTVWSLKYALQTEKHTSLPLGFNINEAET